MTSINKTGELGFDIARLTLALEAVFCSLSCSLLIRGLPLFLLLLATIVSGGFLTGLIIDMDADPALDLTSSAVSSAVSTGVVTSSNELLRRRRE